MKKDNKLTVFYDDFNRKNIYKLNGVDVSETMEILKDKWEREIIDNKCRLFQLDMSIQMKLQNQLALTEKALELAVENLFEEFGCSKYYNKTCEKGDNGEVCYQCLKEEYLQRAKEMIKSE